MPLRPPSNLLDRSAQEASRLLSLSCLDQIDSAHARLGDQLDQEALHDFRVGIRRLRSAIRAYRSELEGSVSGKMRRRLRDLARATNDGRDVEVQLAWLGKQSPLLGPDDIAGFYWLVGRLEDRKQKTHERAVADVARRYQKVAAMLRRGLGILRIELQTAQGQRPATFREVTGALAERQVQRLREDLGRIQGAGDAEQAHRTRISVKRLRYLMEPVARGNRRAGALIRRFKEAQDLLGEHHDMHVFSSGIASFREGVSASKFSGLEPGLTTLARLADDAGTAAFDRFQSIWGGELGSRILARADEVGSVLVEGATSHESRVTGEKPPLTSDQAFVSGSMPPPSVAEPEPIKEELATRDS
ncbi:MAG: CHAD domain-containing protein [Gemmatimonadales bacterium]